ncbi:MAG: tetratricopeptide repeat protein [Candidatus Tritonobacter lacicola]|nr:tetratricopeptide repeat protein [Candidatus Tritonobacter lacicola]
MRTRFWLVFAFLVAFVLCVYIFRKETTPRRQVYYRRGLDFAMTGKYDIALSELNKAIAYDPGFAPAYNNIGVIYSRLGRKKDAITALERAIALDPVFPEARYNLGKIYMDLALEDRALEQLKEAVRFDPDYGKAREALAEIYYGLAREKYGREQYNQAEYDISRAYDHNPERADVIDLWAKTEVKLGQYDKALLLFEKASARDQSLGKSSDISDALEQKGEALYRKGEFDDAERYLVSAVSKDAENGRANYFLGLCYSRKGDIDGAIAHLRRGLILDNQILPDTGQAEYHASLAAGMKRTKEYERAIREYELSRSIDPAADVGKALAECCFWLGRDRSERGQNDRASSELEKAVELEPHNKEYRRALAKALGDSGNYGRAVAEYRALSALEPGSLEVRVELVRVLIKISLFDEAISELEKVERMKHKPSLEKELSEAYYGRGRVAEDAEEFQKAIQDYAHVVKVAPGNKNAWLRLGICREQTGDINEAMKVYRRYLDDPDIGWQCHYHLGICFSKGGDRDSAVAFAGEHLVKADVLQDSGKFNDAMQECRKAIEIAPDWWGGYFDSSALLFGRMEYKKALPYAEKCIDISHDRPEHYNNLGVIYGKLGRYNDAEMLFHQAIKMKSPYYRACINLSYLYGLMKKDNESIWWAKQAGQIKRGFSHKGESGFWLR